MKTALIIVDVQNDFCEGGPLAVAGGAAVATAITNHLATNVDQYTLTVATRDWHNPLPDTNDGHFPASADPDFVATWPVHCVRDTPGAEYHPNLALPGGVIHCLKGEGRQDYSGFSGRVLGAGRLTAGEVTLAGVLRGNGIDQVDIVGIATDHCVKATALDALGAGLSVRVLVDLTAGVGVESTRKAVADMADAGIVIVTKEAA